MHARMHPSVSLRAAADHQQTVDMTCGAAVELGRCSDRPLCRSAVRVAVAAAPRALGRRRGRGSSDAPASRGGRSRANVGARPRSATRRGCGTGSTCEPSRWGACVSSTPASPGDCQRAEPPVARARPRARAFDIVATTTSSSGQ